MNLSIEDVYQLTAEIVQLFYLSVIALDPNGTDLSKGYVKSVS
jgi:hypothetical protein